jgi:hypothetical protein
MFVDPSGYGMAPSELLTLECVNVKFELSAELVEYLAAPILSYDVLNSVVKYCAALTAPSNGIIGPVGDVAARSHRTLFAYTGRSVT